MYNFLTLLVTDEVEEGMLAFVMESDASGLQEAWL